MVGASVCKLSNFLVRELIGTVKDRGNSCDVPVACKVIPVMPSTVVDMVAASWGTTSPEDVFDVCITQSQ